MNAMTLLSSRDIFGRKSDSRRSDISGQPEPRLHSWVSRDGLRLYSRVYDAPGSGAGTVLCLHGLTRNSKDFEDLAPHLSRRYRVICPDLRGRGLSAYDPTWQNYHPGIYLADLADLLASLGAKRLAVIGSSLGGRLAMLLPGFLPGSIAGIVLNDIGPEVDPVGAARIRGQAGRLPPVGSWEEAAEQLRLAFGAAWPGLSDDTWRRLVRRSYRENATGIPVLECDPKVGEAARTIPAIPGDPWAVWAGLTSLSLPVLAIRGALSDFLSEATLARMRREMPELITLTVEQRGHIPFLDEPECLAAIDDFLAKIAF